MLALTLRHPWPFCVTHLGKLIENRGWSPSPKQLAIGDRFAIHGGKVPKEESVGMMRVVATAIMQLRRLGFTMTTDPEIVIAGGIVSVATFGGVTENANLYGCNCDRRDGSHAVDCSSSTQLDDPWFEKTPGNKGWLLRDVIVLPAPIPCKGAQGLWTVPDDVLRQIDEQLKGGE